MRVKRRKARRRGPFSDFMSFYSPQMVATVNTTKCTIENDLTIKKEKTNTQISGMYSCKADSNQKFGPMRNVMVALPNICGALCSTQQSLADAHYCRAVTLPRRETR